MRRTARRRIFVLTAQFDENSVLTHFYYACDGYKHISARKTETPSARYGYAYYVVFGKRYGNIADLAKIFAVAQIYDFFLFKLRK